MQNFKTISIEGSDGAGKSYHYRAIKKIPN